MAIWKRQCFVRHASWSELLKAGYKSVEACGVDGVEECRATAEMRTEESFLHGRLLGLCRS